MEKKKPKSVTPTGEMEIDDMLDKLDKGYAKYQNQKDRLVINVNHNSSHIIKIYGILGTIQDKLSKVISAVNSKPNEEDVN